MTIITDRGKPGHPEPSLTIRSIVEMHLKKAPAGTIHARPDSPSSAHLGSTSSSSSPSPQHSYLSSRRPRHKQPTGVWKTKRLPSSAGSVSGSSEAEAPLLQSTDLKRSTTPSRDSDASQDWKRSTTTSWDSDASQEILPYNQEPRGMLHQRPQPKYMFPMRQQHDNRTRGRT